MPRPETPPSPPSLGQTSRRAGPPAPIRIPPGHVLTPSVQVDRTPEESESPRILFAHSTEANRGSVLETSPTASVERGGQKLLHGNSEQEYIRERLTTNPKLVISGEGSDARLNLDQSGCRLLSVSPSGNSNLPLIGEFPLCTPSKVCWY